MPTQAPPDGHVVELLLGKRDAVLEHDPEEPEDQGNEYAEGEEEDDHLEGGERVAGWLACGEDGCVGVSIGEGVAVDAGAEGGRFELRVCREGFVVMRVVVVVCRELDALDVAVVDRHGERIPGSTCTARGDR